MKSYRHDARRAAALLLPALWALAPGAQAQTYPAKSVRVIVPQTAGSASDTVGRIVGQRVSSLLGQQFIIDNRPGAGGLSGMETAARAAPDGYTLMVASIS